MDRFSCNTNLVRQIIDVELNESELSENERASFIKEFESLWKRLASKSVSDEVLSDRISDSDTKESVEQLGGSVSTPNCQNQEERSVEAVQRKIDDDDSIAEDPTLIENLWGCPTGDARPVVVAHMNFFVNQDGHCSPCEIGLIAFTLKHGILNEYTTTFEPVSIPRSHKAVCVSASDHFGVELPFPEEEEQDTIDEVALIKKIKEIEDFLGLYAPNRPIFSLSSSVEDTRTGLTALCTKLDKTFNHDVCNLEEVMVALSNGGLLTVANLESISMPTVVAHLRDAISLIKNYNSNKRKDSAISFGLLRWKYVEYDRYFMMGGTKRVAARNERFPAVALGIFENEKEAKNYLEVVTGGNPYSRELACRIHDNRQYISVNRFGQSRRCAFGVAKTWAYLILDALLPHYSFVPRVGRHYPVPT
ncbi:unnamed protein product [Orchesella dallaii]|uniref:Maelstrom domain-containing protein n=1 Tax=Orchesella dallaii TaxID=48710 RepID=A0ABP1QPM6_9HEXA